MADTEGKEAPELPENPEELIRLLSDPEECDDGAMEGFARRLKQEVEALPVAVFLERMRRPCVCVDVRSPAEWEHGHIPGSHNLPLFDNDERAEVGTKFKKIGRTQAMRLGMERVRPKLEQLVAEARALVDKITPGQESILVHCWRGGMRSKAIAFLLKTRGGLGVHTLEGGYKAFRAWGMGQYCYLGDTRAMQQRGDRSGDTLLAQPSEEEWRKRHPTTPMVVIIGGRTGTGKTRVLHALRDGLGKQIIDLEGLANHCGSAFGWVGHDPQPTTQHFGNLVAMEWAALDPDQPVFIEDEGPNVGKVSVPPGLYRRMRDAPVILRLKVPFQLRIGVLVKAYASPEAKEKTPNWRERMERAISGLHRRLGPERVAEAIKFLETDDAENFGVLMLTYYDRLYDKHIQNASGTGGGHGTRAGELFDVELEDIEVYDELEISRRVLARLESVAQR